MHVLARSSLDAAVTDTEGFGSENEQGAKKGTTKGVVNYVERALPDEPLFIKLFTQEEKPSNLELHQCEITVQDVRPIKDSLSLEKNGFGLYKLELPTDIDWDNDEDIKSRYYPLVEKLLLHAAKGSTSVHIFDTTKRNGYLKDTGGKKEITPGTVAMRSQPVGMTHVDYTSESGIDRLDALLPEKAEKLRQTPFAVIQVWRPLKGPVRASPLGMIDASTVESSDLTPYAIKFPERTGYNFAVHHNPKHKWFYAHEMRTDEAYVFVCFDSRLERARFTPHSGFKDLSIGPDAPPRESIELRAYVFWENDEKRELHRGVW